MGAENNAGTGHEFTYFYAKVLREYAPDLIDLLADMMRPKLDGGDFDQERQVILEEIARYEDMPRFKLFNYLMEHYFAPTAWPARCSAPPRRSPAMTRRGDARVLGAPLRGQQHDLRHRRQFRLGGGARAGGGALRRLGTRRDRAHADRGATRTSDCYVYQRPDLQQQLVDIGFPGVSYSDPDRYAAEVLGTILGDSTGSRLYWQVQETGPGRGRGRRLHGHGWHRDALRCRQPAAGQDPSGAGGDRGSRSSACSTSRSARTSCAAPRPSCSAAW